MFLSAGRAGHRAVNERETGVAGLSYNSQEVFPGSGCFIRLQGFLCVLNLLCFGEKSGEYRRVKKKSTITLKLWYISTQAFPPPPPCIGFLKIFHLFLKIFISLGQVFVVACRILSGGMWTLSCNLWDLAPWPKVEPPPHLSPPTPNPDPSIGSRVLVTGRPRKSPFTGFYLCVSVTKSQQKMDIYIGILLWIFCVPFELLFGLGYLIFDSRYNFVDFTFSLLDVWSVSYSSVRNIFGSKFLYIF